MFSDTGKSIVPVLYLITAVFISAQCSRSCIQLGSTSSRGEGLSRDWDTWEGRQSASCFVLCLGCFGGGCIVAMESEMQGQRGFIRAGVV